MAKIPLILHLSTASQGLPGLAYLLSRGRTRAAAYIAVGCLVGLLSNLIALVWGRLYGNNQVFSYISSPITLSCFLFGLAELQGSHRERRVIRWLVLPVVIAWIVLVAFVEDVAGFDLVTGPLYSLLLLIIGMWTLLRRAVTPTSVPLFETDWFWISLGLALSGATTAMASPVAAILMERGRTDLLVLAWQVRGACLVGSFLMVSWGVYRGPMVSKFSTAP